MKYLKRFIQLLIDILAALAVIGVCVALYRLGIVSLLERLFSLSDLQATVLRRVGVTASLFAGLWLAAKYYERRKITEYAFSPLAISLGALSGAALIGITLLSLFAMGNYQLVSIRGYDASLTIIVVIVLGVVFEEVVFRGVIFRLFEQHAGTVVALVVQSTVFGFLHLFNDGTSAVTFVSVTLIGAFWTLLYVYTRNIWVTIANHAAWNVTIFVTGVPLSGNEKWRLLAPLESSYQGPVWLTGGEFGPEDSMITILVMAGACSGLAVWGRRRGHFMAASWRETQLQEPPPKPTC